MPPAEAFAQLVDFANEHGEESGKPYFFLDGINPLTKADWEKMRSKFYCPVGQTNVWTVPSLRNSERLKIKHKALHLNQKPIALIRNLITMSSDQHNVIWWAVYYGYCGFRVRQGALQRRE